MSSPVHRAKDLDPALMYAPPRVRDYSEQSERSEQSELSEQSDQSEPMPMMPDAESAPPIDWPWKPQPEIDSTPPIDRRWKPQPEFDSSFSGDRAVLAVQRRLALDPEWLPEPPRASGTGRGVWKFLLWMCGAAGAAALVAWTLVSPPGVALFENETARAAVLGITNFLGKQIPSTVAAAARPQQPDPRRGLGEAVPRAPKDQSQVSKSVTTVVASARTFAPAPAAMAMPAPAAMTMPVPVAVATPTPVVNAMLPPMPTAARPTAPPPAAPAATVPTMIVRPLDADELASLIKRGEALINTGDLSSARLALRRAAEAGDGRAALLLAGTYDPTLLDRLGFQENSADIAMARLWYQRAQQFGSAEAPRRLQQLATKTNSAP